MAQQADSLTLEWRPPFAPLVLGRYEPRPTDLGPGELPEQRWAVACGRCGAAHQGVCTTGAVRAHIARFAAQHVHADAFGAAKQAKT